MLAMLHKTATTHEASLAIASSCSSQLDGGAERRRQDRVAKLTLHCERLRSRWIGEKRRCQDKARGQRAGESPDDVENRTDQVVVMRKMWCR